MIINKDEDKVFMKAALFEAENAAQAGEIPVGAVIVRNGEIISRAHNESEKEGSQLYHAEMTAIDNACKIIGGWRLDGCTLYVTLEPCAMCAGAALNSRVGRIVYGATDKRSGAFGGAVDLRDGRYDCLPDIESGVMIEECLEILRSFFAGRRKEQKHIHLTKKEELEKMKLNEEFYKQDALNMAKLLVGKLLCRRFGCEVKKTRITETECYLGEEDTACHAHRGKTERNAPLYERGGIAYIYLCYGIHSLLNVVSGEEGKPEAVLIRGTEEADGPGKLTKQLKITKELNRENLITSDILWLEDDGYIPDITTYKRVGIDYADEKDRERLWRFKDSGKQTDDALPK